MRAFYKPRAVLTTHHLTDTISRIIERFRNLGYSQSDIEAIECQREAIQGAELTERSTTPNNVLITVSSHFCLSLETHPAHP
jgi:hypothetical protein